MAANETTFLGSDPPTPRGEDEDNGAPPVPTPPTPPPRQPPLPPLPPPADHPAGKQANARPGPDREAIFEALRRRGAEILHVGRGQAAACPSEVAEKVSALVVAVEMCSCAPAGARALVGDIVARKFPQVTMVLLLRRLEGEEEVRPTNEQPSLHAATKAFIALKADGVFWEPKTDEGLEDVVEMWFTCAAARAEEREREQQVEEHRHEALRTQAESFWSEVHTIFVHIPQISVRLKEPQVGGRVGRHHEVVKHLGTGAHADIFLLKHVSSNEFKALKAVAKERMSALKHVQAISKEISNLKRLSHPNIVGFLGAAHTPKHVCLLLEFGGFRRLSQVQRDAGDEEGRLPLPSAEGFFRQVACGLQHCHSRSLAHRDLRHDNVIVGEDGLTAKLIDFRSADELSSRLELVGSLPFIAPEVLAGEAADYSPAQADVWSLGVLLLEMLCGLGFLANQLCWNLPMEPRPELAGEMRVLLKDWEGLMLSVVSKQHSVGPGYRDLLGHMLCSTGVQRWSVSQVGAYSAYDEVS